MKKKRVLCLLLAAVMIFSLGACGKKDPQPDPTPDPQPCSHVWDEGTVTKYATIEEEGELLYTCTLCGETRTEVIPKSDAEIPPQPVKPMGTETTDGAGDTSKTDPKKEDTKPADKPKEEEYNKKYVIKVNRKANVVTVYKKDTKTGEYTVPVRADYCSCGGADTPLGTFYTTNQYRWRALIQNMYGQYATRISGDILFHSVPYSKKNDPSSLVPGEYNKLGKTASHGCVRLSVEAAKWIFDNCDSGTRVTIYEDSNPGPLTPTKLKKIADDCGWDPTDTDPKNPWLKDPNYMPWVDPNKPTEPEEPGTPEEPEEPTEPGTPETPENPDPETPEQPTEPQPEQPGDPGTPEEP